MKLKYIVIIGFKSFADKTELEFHDGITCIVGPNGCGKSNIGDAVRWVLGEQSAKSMRGAKMPDVIFAGASTRKPLNFAEVTITFSEINGALPVEYDELSITRRLHRSGESEYLINGQLARLKDVQHLLLDSGVGKNNFSIFEQGKIDQIIQYSPLERRYIFEEASGITRFLQRKRETLRKLEDVDLNLSRLGDIHKEVEKQITTLQEQAETAKTFKEQKKRLENLEKGYALARIDAYHQKASDLNAKEEESKAKHAESLKEFKEVEETWQSLRKSLDEKESAHQRAREAFLSKQNEKDLKEQSFSNAQERLKELKATKEKVQKEMAMLKEQKTAWSQQIAELKKQKEVQQKEVTLLEKEANARDQEFKTVEKELQSVRGKQTQAHQDRVLAFQKEASLESQWKQALYRLETHQEKKTQFAERKKSFASLISEKEKEVKEKQNLYTKVQESIDASRKKLASTEEALKKLLASIDETRDAQDEVNKKHHELTAREKVLLQLKQEFAGFTSGGKKILQASQDAKSPLYKLIQGLNDFIVPKLGQEGIVNAVLRPYAQTLVVESKTDLQTVLSFAEKNKIRDFSIVCLELLPKTAGKALKQELVNSPNPVSRYFLSDVTLANHLDSALEEFLKSGKSAWSPSGCLVDPKGVLYFPGTNEQSIFSREVELTSLAKKIEETKQEKQKLEDHLQACFKQKQKLQDERNQLDQEFRKSEMRGVEANFVLQRTKGDLDRIHKEVKEVEDEIQALEKTMSELKTNSNKLQKELSDAQAQLSKIQAKAEEIESSLSTRGDEWNLKRQKLTDAKNKFTDADAEFRKTAHALSLIEIKDAETTRLIERLQQEYKDAEKLEKELSGRGQTTSDEIASLSTLIDKIAAQSEDFGQVLQRAKKETNVLEAKMKTLDKQVKDAEGKLHQLGIQLAHVETGTSSIEQDLQTRFNVTADELRDTIPPLELSLEKTEKEIKQLKGMLDVNQNVNLAAIEDCEKQQIRAKELNSQIHDLSSSKEDLLQMISALDKECREIFMETFEKIRANFKKNFQILFKGGEADLELLESNDVLEAGIEITVKPPGKQMRSLSLLSGGEKCLTAMALLFSIFEVKASPFCILDEIDAPLDDSNVERFLNIVRQFVDRCQFIIVTHNKRTMSLADRLFGVSMEEKGVSKLLSMEFSKKSKPEPILV